MIKQYAYIGFSGDIEGVRTAIEKAIGCRLAERHSSYWGGTYFLFQEEGTGCRLQLHRNRESNGEWILLEFAGTEILSNIDGPADAVSALVDAIVATGGNVLARRTKEIDDA